jgi:integrase
MTNVPRPKRPKKRPKHVTEKELDKVCNEIRSDYREKLKAGEINEGELIWLIPLYRFTYYSGLRGSELARLRWRDLDFERGLILLSDEQKSKEEGTSPLIPQAVKVLHEVAQGEPNEYVFHAPKGERFDRRTDTFRDYVNRRFRRYRRKAGIKRKLTVHGLRHGFATRLAQEGVSPHAIQRACRHKAFRTTQKYINLSAVDVRDDVAAAFS